jgi:serine/threonine protein phosphatase PrpC
MLLLDLLLHEQIEPHDEFMILASDGVWDVMDNQVRGLTHFH